MHIFCLLNPPPPCIAESAFVLLMAANTPDDSGGVEVVNPLQAQLLALQRRVSLLELQPLQAQLMALQSQVSMLEGQLQAACAMIQNLPSREGVLKEVHQLQQEKGIMNRQMLGLAGRCTNLENALTIAGVRHFKLAEAMHRVTGMLMGSLENVSDCHFALKDMVAGGFDPQLSSH